MTNYHMGNSFFNKNYYGNIVDIYKNYKPAFSNLYNVTLYNYMEYVGTGFDGKEISNKSVLLHATSIKFGGETLNLNRNKTSREFSLEGYDLSENLQISWREDENFSVKRYHQEWLGQFYDKNNDCYISHGVGKTRTKEDQFYYKSGISVNTNSSLFRVMDIELPNSTKAKFGIRLYKVLPTDFGDFDLSWNKSGDIITYTLTYKVTDWDWIGKYNFV